MSAAELDRDNYDLAEQAELLAARADVNARDDTYGSTPLLLASAAGHTSCVGVLLAAPACDANIADVEGRRPLLYAARRGVIAEDGRF